MASDRIEPVCVSRTASPASSFRTPSRLAKSPMTVGNGGRDSVGLFVAGFNRKSSTQGHAAQRAVTQDELMPDGHQGVQSGEDEDDGSGILMQFAIRPGSPLNGRGERGKLQPKNDTGTPMREAAYQPVIGSAIRNR